MRNIDVDVGRKYVCELEYSDLNQQLWAATRKAYLHSLKGVAEIKHTSLCHPSSWE